MKFWLMFIALLVSQALAGVFLYRWIEARDVAWQLNRDVGECIEELKSCDKPEIIYVEPTTDEYLDWVETEYFEDMPVFQPAVTGTDPYFEDWIDSPVEYDEPECLEYDYFFDNPKECVTWSE